MNAVLMLLRVQRAALRSWLSLALLLAVVGGGVLAAGAGARRTDSAYPRFLSATQASDVLVNTSIPSPLDNGSALLSRIVALPQVESGGIGFFVLGGVRLPTGQPIDINDVSPIALPDPRYGRSIDRFKVLEGRLPDPASVDEISVSFPLANDPRFHLHVGDVLTMRLITANDMQTLYSTGGASSPSLLSVARGANLHLHIVGIMASPLAGDFPPLPTHSGASFYLTPGFLHRYGPQLVSYGGAAIKLRHGPADLPAFEAAAEKVASGVEVSFQVTSAHEAVVQNTIHLQAVGLGILAALAAAVLLLILGQGVARRIALDAADNLALRALGATRGQLWSAAMARATLAGVAGAAGAVVVAVALSPLMPLGNARIAEPDPGLDLDVAVVLGGGLALALVVSLMALWPAWQAAGSRAAQASVSPPGSRLAGLLSRAGFPATAVSGVRLALEPGRGRNAVPVRSAICACVMATATVAGALTFSASLGKLLDTPHLYGWNWNALVSGLIDPTDVPHILGTLPGVTAYAEGTTGNVTIAGGDVGGLAMQPGKGSVTPVVLQGRAPQGDGEIFLGTQTDTAARIGDQVRVEIGGHSAQLRLVGRGVLPALSDAAQLGTGAWFSYHVLETLLGNPQAIQIDTFLVRTTGEAATARLEATFGADAVLRPSAPTGLVGFGDLSALPLVLAGVLAAGALATLAHAVTTSVQRRRHELAVLKTLGFVRRQLVLTVAWQTTTVAALAALIGAPLGGAAGRWAWTVFAGQQGMASDPVLPIASLLLLIPGALLAANLVGAIPGRYAARTPAAAVLRSE